MSFMSLIFYRCDGTGLPLQIQKRKEYCLGWLSTQVRNSWLVYTLQQYRLLHMAHVTSWNIAMPMVIRQEMLISPFYTNFKQICLFQLLNGNFFVPCPWSDLISFLCFWFIYLFVLTEWRWKLLLTFLTFCCLSCLLIQLMDYFQFKNVLNLRKTFIMYMLIHSRLFMWDELMFLVLVLKYHPQWIIILYQEGYMYNS